ncbi:MAG: hypothetical protein VX733_13490 [Candidatus Latescibacterota bacterium]|nr:hypothetical protein [Candidatus Latescibacterota bacterium]
MAGYSPHSPLLILDTPTPPPTWALLERQLIDQQAEACRMFYAKYFDQSSGYLLAVPRWGGDDGPDDAAENQLNWTVLHALGGPEDILNLFRQGFDGHLRQYTEARTLDVPMARDGMYYKEFPVSLDWFHHGEGLSTYFLYGLCDPHDPEFVRRCRTWAAMYTGDDPFAPNYDPNRRIIRSMFNGSRGPLLRQATAVDWAGDPIQVEGRFHLGHGERSYAEMLAHFEDYSDIVGDHPLNLEATHLGFIAYAATGEERYRRWLLEYLDAWAERTNDNAGIIPSNIGLDGSIGGECDGKWWGGCYGWGFTVVVPQTGALSNRPACYSRPVYGFAHGLLMSGSQSYVDTWCTVIDKVNENAQERNGVTLYPHMYGDDGWYDFRPHPFTSGALESWYLSQRDTDRQRVSDNDWVRYVCGENAGFPETALRADLERVRGCMQKVAEDTTSPDARLADDMNSSNPCVTDNLVRLMLGGLPVGRSCHTLHCRLRYFDADRRRAGLPPDVGALVGSMSDDRVTVKLVNLSPVHARTVIVQGGAYAEHKLTRVRYSDVTAEVGGDGTAFALRLQPSSGGELEIDMKRFAGRPTFAFPWDR